MIYRIRDPQNDPVVLRSSLSPMKADRHSSVRASSEASLVSGAGTTNQFAKAENTAQFAGCEAWVEGFSADGLV